jgi:phosphatidate phosphatase APP1
MWNLALMTILTALSATPADADQRKSIPEIQTKSTDEITYNPGAEIDRNEEVLFYPTYGKMENDGKIWTLQVRGSVYDPEMDSVKRAVFIEGMRRTLGVEANSPQAAILEQRLRPFLVDHKSGKEITIQIGPTIARLGQSGADGSIATQVRLQADLVPALGQESVARSLNFEVVLPKTDPRRFNGRVQLIGLTGWSVISDIDDTIKISQVADRKEMLANTFLREFRAVPGMADAYRQLAEDGFAFHYVSGSPWQLYKPLADFFLKERFPAGSLHLKNFRLSNPATLLNLFAQEDYKQAAIEPILMAFPLRKFILIGDSGEKDPEIYGALARMYSAQIALVLIRNVNNEKPNGARLQKAFVDVVRERWRLYTNAEEIGPFVTDVTKSKQ